jgi:hypothetical protein
MFMLNYDIKLMHIKSWNAMVYSALSIKMSHNFRNYNPSASDSNAKRRKIVLAPPGSNVPRNDG